MRLSSCFLFCCVIGLVSQAYCRNLQFVERDSDEDLLAQPTKGKLRIDTKPQARVFPNPIIAKKLLLLKFKKLVPISLILLRSENGGEPELVPVYQSSLIPSNVEFVNTPGGLTGHEDVQAIAIPSDFSNKNEIAQALQVVSASGAKESLNNKGPSEEDEPLEVSEDDEGQILKDFAKPPGVRSSLVTRDNVPFEESSLYLYPYQENRGTKLSRRNHNRYHN